MNETPGTTPLVPYSQDAAELARTWCFICRRRKWGTCSDYEPDIALLFQSMLDVGFSMEELLLEVTKESGLPPLKRDRSEYFWQFKRRLELQKFGDPKAKGKPPETADQLAEKRAKQMVERQRAEEERLIAKLDVQPALEELRKRLRKTGS